LYSVFPAWLATIVHVPAPMKLTVEPEIVQTEPLPGSIVNVTGFPDGPPVATTLYVGSPTAEELGGEDVNVIVCVPLEGPAAEARDAPVLSTDVASTSASEQRRATADALQPAG
jgi:hypothetical protein